MKDQPRLRDARLVGRGVTLRPVRSSDAHAAFPLIHGCEEVTRWLVWDGPEDELDLAESYADWNLGSAAGGINYRFAIEVEGHGFVGAASLRFEGHPFVGDVGYWVAQRFWGQGIGSEANRLAAHLAFKHLSARAMTAVVFVGNDASARLLEKVGYVRELDAHGVPLVGRPTELDQDSWTYGMTPFDFRRAMGEWRPLEQQVELR